MSSLIAMSLWCNFGPVWYQPTTFSRAESKQSKCYANMFSEYNKCNWGTTNKNYYQSLSGLTIDFLKHSIHIFQVIVIQEPH